ncbi:MAG: aldehyde dehydrogenase EutE, partial [Verrucomicrobiota bacterium]
MSSPVNETLIREVIQEVLGKLDHGKPRHANTTPVAPITPQNVSYTPPSCGVASPKAGKHGVFDTAAQACEAAHEGFLQLQKKGIEARRQVERIVKTMCEDRAN